jgi:hypothetical protein
MMEHNYSIRRYKKGDETNIFELWKAVYPDQTHDQEKWSKWWRWMYEDNPSGSGLIWVAEHNGKIEGQYPLVFNMLKVGNDVFKVAQNIDLMTHPEYGNQGIFAALERSALSDISRSGVNITLGFTSRGLAYSGHLKRNWFEISAMSPMIIPLNWNHSVKIITENKYLQKILAVCAKVVFNGLIIRTGKQPVVDIDVVPISDFDNRVTQLWNEVSSQHDILCVRNKNYLNWRYSSPNVDYFKYAAQNSEQLFGYVVFEYVVQDKVKICRIFDLIANSEKITLKLLSHVINLCKKDQVDLIYYPLIAKKDYYRILKKVGFISSSLLKNGRFICHSTLPSVQNDFLKNSENWLVQLGDSDSI